MSIEVRVPTLPESVADATLIGWHKQPGDPVRRDENLVDLETDKVVLEVPAPSDGVLAKVLHTDGDTVIGDEVLALLEDADEGQQPAASTTTEAPAPTAQPASGDEPVLTPALRRMLRQLKLDPGEIPATGKNGRLLKSDVIAYLDQRDQDAPPEVSLDTVAWQPEPEVDKTAEPSASMPTAERPEQRVPMTRLRARVAERLVQAQQHAAILTTFNEVNLQAVMDLRKRYRESFEQRHGIRLGFMSFFVKAAVEALKRFPVINASIDGQDIIYHGYFDIGIAVGSPRGLVVPILRDCDQLSFAEIEQGIAAFAKKAEDGKLSYEDLSGGTFTISNGGVFGSMLSTPILNPPQSAILGMHTIQQRPVAENGAIVIRPMMYLAVSYDHRIIDGREAVQFLVTIKQELEDPARLLLNI